MQRQTMEVYKGRAAERSYTVVVSGTPRFRAWNIADEPIDPVTYQFPISKNVEYDAEQESLTVKLLSEETGALTVGAIYRWRVEGVEGPEAIPAIGGRLYVGEPYGQ
jgi:hypothetical protein